MTASSRPYAETHAAGLLADALRRYTSRHPGGLRALAVDLNIKQATVLSHMAKGRIGIPLDRAAELAAKLDIEPANFCLAVLEQRAPAIYAAIEDELHLRDLKSMPDLARRACNKIAAARKISEKHVDIIEEVLADPRPAERWLDLYEVPTLSMIRKCFPQGLGAGDLELLRDAIDIMRELEG